MWTCGPVSCLLRSLRPRVPVPRTPGYRCTAHHLHSPAQHLHTRREAFVGLCSGLPEEQEEALKAHGVKEKARPGHRGHSPGEICSHELRPRAFHTLRRGHVLPVKPVDSKVKKPSLGESRHPPSPCQRRDVQKSKNSGRQTPVGTAPDL